MSRLLTLAGLLLAAAGATAQQGLAPAQLKCAGNEPFWSIDVGPGNVLLDRLAEPREQPPLVTCGRLAGYLQYDACD
jgi:uncharacterized membrane protein